MLQEYKRSNREVKRKRKKAVNDLWNKNCEYIDRCMHGQKSAEAWKILRSIKNPKQENVKIGLIQEKQWVEYFSVLLKEDRNEFLLEKMEDQTEADDTLSIEVSTDELECPLKCMKNGKSSGPGKIPIELIKYGPFKLKKKLAEFMSLCVKQGTVPRAWTEGHITPIYKKGNKKLCSNYRGITVTSSLSRLYG